MSGNCDITRVLEAYLRVVGNADPGWDHRGDSFAAASQAMRQILVDQARRGEDPQAPRS